LFEDILIFSFHENIDDNNFHQCNNIHLKEKNYRDSAIYGQKIKAFIMIIIIIIIIIYIFKIKILGNRPDYVRYALE